MKNSKRSSYHRDYHTDLRCGGNTIRWSDLLHELHCTSYWHTHGHTQSLYSLWCYPHCSLLLLQTTEKAVLGRDKVLKGVGAEEEEKVIYRIEIPANR